MFFLTRAY